MKRDEMNIDEILKRHLPRASHEDVDTDGEAVRKRILEMRFQPEPSAAPPPAEAAPKAPDVWLHDYHVGILIAVDELHGYGDPVRITLKAQEVLEEKVVWGTAVYLILLLMQRMGLVSSSPIDPEKPAEFDQYYFALTDLGRETLAKALAERRRAAERVRRPFEDFA